MTKWDLFFALISSIKKEANTGGAGFFLLLYPCCCYFSLYLLVVLFFFLFLSFIGCTARIHFTNTFFFLNLYLNVPLYLWSCWLNWLKCVREKIYITQISFSLFRCFCCLSIIRGVYYWLFCSFFSSSFFLHQKKPMILCSLERSFSYQLYNLI
jgi:hypothetical protein